MSAFGGKADDMSHQLRRVQAAVTVAHDCPHWFAEAHGRDHTLSTPKIVNEDWKDKRT
jgi:hypothetical protein